MSLPAAEVAQQALLNSDAPVGLRTPSGVNSGMLGALWPFGGEHPWLTMLACHDSLQACSALAEHLQGLQSLPQHICFLSLPLHV